MHYEEVIERNVRALFHLGSDLFPETSADVCFSRVSIAAVQRNVYAYICADRALHLC